MERSEPTFVPEWLKSSGSVSGGGTTAHQFTSSSLHSDGQTISKSARNKPLVSISDNDSGRASISDRTTSSYFRRTSSSNGSAHLRSYSSFGRSHRDRDWDKDIYEFRDKEKSVLGDHRHRDYPDPLGNILPSRFEKDVLRRSHSSVSGKRGESWPRKVVAESSNVNKNNHNNDNALLSGGSTISNVNKTAFERDFPSLGADERQVDPEIGRVPSPGLSTAIQSLPIGNSSVIGGDGWTSALAEVPVIVGSNGTSASSVQQAVNASPVPVASTVTTGRNMAETLAQGPTRAQTAPQLSVGTQRLEELAVKQSRQLIPVTPSMPKALTLNTSEKPKAKIGQQPHQSSHLVTHSPRGGPVKPDVSKTSSVGKLHVLKPSRERNGITAAKDSLSPTSGSKLPSSPLAVPSVVGSAPLGNPGNNTVLASSERKPVVAVMEKRPTSQAQSRNDFFNLVRKKSMTNSSSAVPDSGPSVSTCVLGKADETGAPSGSRGNDEPLADRSDVDQHLSEAKVDLTCTGDACSRLQESLNNGTNHSSSDAIRVSEEEEAAFLRSLGWEENAGEDEGLTEEEISAFYRDVSKYLNSKPSSRALSVPVNLQMGSIGGVSSDSKLES